MLRAAAACVGVGSSSSTSARPEASAAKSSAPRAARVIVLRSGTLNTLRRNAQCSPNGYLGARILTMDDAEVPREAATKGRALLRDDRTLVDGVALLLRARAS